MLGMLNIQPGLSHGVEIDLGAVLATILPDQAERVGALGPGRVRPRSIVVIVGQGLFGHLALAAVGYVVVDIQIRELADLYLAILVDAMDAQDIRGRVGYRAFHASHTFVVGADAVGWAEAIQIVGVTTAAAMSELADVRPATGSAAAAAVVCVGFQINTTAVTGSFPARATCFATSAGTEGAFRADIATTAAVVGIFIEIDARAVTVGCPAATFVDTTAIFAGPDFRTAVAAAAAVICICLQIDAAATAIGFTGGTVGKTGTRAADLVVLTVVVANPAMSRIVLGVDAGAVTLCCAG